ncbi:hypothetical protein [Pseudobacteroides cellulosolvens]|uniref:hypothetical protein n=1 Tax=Pseudobacteroides cellulosolvens TaxID=35825 RepID=UPI001A9A66E8|nr:hypothetical protein [Pseudobacteroides cellulosolvens]
MQWRTSKYIFCITGVINKHGKIGLKVNPGSFASHSLETLTKPYFKNLRRCFKAAYENCRGEKTQKFPLRPQKREGLS